MKLKQPITITITDPAFAVLLCRILNWATDAYAAISGHYEPHTHPLLNEFYQERHQIRSHLDRELNSQGINYMTWQPEPTISVGDHRVDFNADGSLDVGCEHISSEQMEQIIKRRAKVLKQ